MKHYIGGFALGFVIGLGFLPAGNEKPAGVLMLSVAFGLAAWGLLP